MIIYLNTFNQLDFAIGMQHVLCQTGRQIFIIIIIIIIYLAWSWATC